MENICCLPTHAYSFAKPPPPSATLSVDANHIDVCFRLLLWMNYGKRRATHCHHQQTVYDNKYVFICKTTCSTKYRNCHLEMGSMLLLWWRAAAALVVVVFIAFGVTYSVEWSMASAFVWRERYLPCSGSMSPPDNAHKSQLNELPFCRLHTLHWTLPGICIWISTHLH